MHIAKFAQNSECKNEDAIKGFLDLSRRSDYQGAMLFASIVNLFVNEFVTPSGKNRFTQAVYLLIDELDDLGRQAPKEALEINDILRHLYDECPNSFGLIGALSAELSTLGNYFTDYVLSRVNKQILFEQLDRDNAIKFLKDILNAPGNRIVVDDPTKLGYYPFTEEAIIAVMSQLRQITPRKIVTNMQATIEELRLVNYDPAQGLVTVDILEDEDILETVFGEGAPI